MLNENYKKVTIQNLQRANDKYMSVFKQSIENMEKLQQSRQDAVSTIMSIENYITKLAGKPREYETKIGEVKIRNKEFNKRIDEIKRCNEQQESVGCGKKFKLGMIAGTGTALFGKSAALSVAMAFGTASTGTAIASLSGAAATNAALAWLGSGSLMVGGLGMAGGQALLLMSGPIGLAIGGTSVLGSLLFKSVTNKELAQKAENATKIILREIERIKEIDIKVCTLNEETIKLSAELTKMLTHISRKKNFLFFTKSEKQELAILMNMTEVLSIKLGETIS